MNLKRSRCLKTALYLALALLYLLHNDFWNWGAAGLLFGLPIGLAYHIGFCLAAALLFHLLVKHAWPDRLDASPEKEAE